MVIEYAIRIAKDRNRLLYPLPTQVKSNKEGGAYHGNSAYPVTTQFNWNASLSVGPLEALHGSKTANYELRDV